MSSSSPASLLDMDLHPGRPPMLRATITGDPQRWVNEHRDALRAAVTDHGSALVRGLGLRDAAEVGAVFRRLAAPLMIEKEAFAARHIYSDGVYSSAKWPPNQPMCMHHELSYLLQPPGLMMFACLQRAHHRRRDRGGRLDGRARRAADGAGPTVRTAGLAAHPQLQRRARGLRSPTRSAPTTAPPSRATAEPTHRVRLATRRWPAHQATPPCGVRHPVTGRRCWFNQIGFLNEWTMAPEVHEYLVDVYGADGLPFNTRFGNGDPIGEDIVQVMNHVYDANTVREPWQAGDLMLVDNVRTAHSREPFTGPRDVVVAMADRYDRPIPGRPLG